MICSECGATYLSDSTSRSTMKTLYGLCHSCGSEPRFGRFLVAFGSAAVVVLTALQFVLIFMFAVNWVHTAIVLGIAVIVYLVLRAIVVRGERVKYRSEEQRRRSTWLQWLAGALCGGSLTLVLVFASLSGW